MIRPFWSRRSLALCGCALAALGWAEVPGADAPAVAPVEAAAPKPSVVRAPSASQRRLEALAGAYFKAHPTRRIYLDLDKPLYQPGETVHLRAFELKTEALTVESGTTYTVQLRDPKGAVVATRQAPTSSAELALDEEAPGGQWTVTVTSAVGTSESRTFSVSQYETPRFKKSLKVERPSYGPGDEVVASGAIRTAADAPFANQEVEARLTVDGAEQRATVRTDGAGKLRVKFRLPTEIARGEAQVSVQLHDAGISESVSARVPVILNRIQLAFYAEGGELVRGLPGRVYFAATDPLGKPADVAGRILDERGAVVASFSALHDGLGRFGFTPARGHAYQAEVTRPVGIAQRFTLPRVLEDGCVLSTVDNFKGSSALLEVQVGCTRARTVVLGAYLRERRIASATAQAPAGELATVKFEVPNLAGVARVTLFSDRLEPLAERLVFRESGRALKISLRPDHPRYSPRDPVTLEVATSDGRGRPVSADLALAVVDDTVLSLANDKTGSLRAHLLLEKELADSVEEPDYYFSSAAKAPAALDALLGTRGWRRFAWQPILNPMPIRRPSRGVGAQFGAGGLMRDELGGVGRARGMAGGAAMPQAAPAPMAREMSKKAEARPVAPEDDAPYQENDVQKVRETAPIPVREEVVRSDFRQTVYWSPAIHTGQDGRAQVQFALSDAVTSFRAIAQGVSSGGLLGRGEVVLPATLPFYADLKLPLEVTVGDRIDLPVTLRNGEATALSVSLKGRFGEGVRLLENTAPSELPLAAGEGRTVSFPIEASARGKTELSFVARAQGLHDELLRTLAVMPPGFPRTESASGTLTPGKTQTQVFHLKSSLPGTLSGKLTLYPSPVATMQSGLQSIIREPVGCFEQASSSNYPNVMVMSYLQEHRGALDTALVEKTQKTLERGYAKVSSYESPERGYEWFGGNPGHEALTAYGLLEFSDMAKVFPNVDRAMVGRTAQWLLNRRDGQGGFQRNARALDSFGAASPEITNAYIVFALAEAGYAPQLARELEAVTQAALASTDPYVVALVTRAQLDANPGGSQAQALVAHLAGMQRPDGSFHGAVHSITRSGGKSLDVETTSLAVLALISGGKLGEVRQAVGWLTQARDGSGGFGSTQATILALKALSAYDKVSSVTASAGEIIVSVNGVEVERAKFEKGRTEPLVLEKFGSALKVGEDEITLTLKGEQPLPFSLAVDHWTTEPASSPDAPVRLTTSLSSDGAEMGTTVRLDATVENVTSVGQPMTLARVGLPGGATFQLWQLKELMATKQIDFFETRPREVILYFRSLPPNAQRHIALDLVAAVPGKYSGPASSAYLYYTAEKKAWASPLKLVISRR